MMFTNRLWGVRMLAGAKQPIHSFLGGKGLGIQQGMSVWVRSPTYGNAPTCEPYARTLVSHTTLVNP